LLAQIKTFHKKGDTIWEQSINPEETPLAPEGGHADELDEEGIPFELDYASGDEGVGEDEEDEEIMVGLAEDLRLLMPSALGAAECRRRGKSILMDQEIELRTGQANEALEKLRVALAHMALTYRVNVRNADSQIQMTRAQAQVKQAHRSVNKHVRTYGRAYQALLNMEASVPQLQPIRREDLKVSGDIVEENRFGQRNDTLAWFWRIGGIGEKEKESDWMTECGYCPCPVLLLLFILHHNSLSCQLVEG
jgi:hypothetical protein